MKTIEEKTSELNISDVSNSVFSITEEQLEKLIEKVKDKITDTLDKEGKSTKGLAITNSVSDTIKSYLKKTLLLLMTQKLLVMVFAQQKI
ncbi:MAG: hypothetical protein M0R46_16965 [Candidatus Muirbacterium halophilum]|nr:hypothetical protein [Candidatus Muirbacterium halophilum]